MKRWSDGTPLLATVQEPWAIAASERWVRVMAENDAPGLWDATGCARIPECLPISATLQDRIRRWQLWYDDLDELNTSFPEPMYWEQRDDMPIAAFNAEGRAIGRAIKTELPSNWTVIVVDVDAWLRDDDDSELILRPGD
ncbi:MAG: hypothetical protein ACRYHC_00905 [Janthinobacterium lividum]